MWYSIALNERKYKTKQLEKETNMWREKGHEERPFSESVHLWEAEWNSNNIFSTAQDITFYELLNKCSRDILMEKNSQFYWMQTVVGQHSYSKGLPCAKSF